MSSDKSSFPVGIEFQSVLRAISKQIYETPLAFIRENVQNAVDAIRIQAHRDGLKTGADDYQIEITVAEKEIVVRDNGIGMSADDLQNFFWTIGASGKRNDEALAAGCVGMFGIGGFANFGVCDKLEVISQTSDAEHGTLTRLSEEDIQGAGVAIPSVTVEVSDKATPRGTMVIGHLRRNADESQLQEYLGDFVRFVPTAISFNGEKISQDLFLEIEGKENLTPIGETRTWRERGLSITGRLYEDRGHTLSVAIEALQVGNEAVNLSGYLRFENGPIDVFKRGFKLCATRVGSTIGVSGRLDCDGFVPTAGRDSLDAETASLMNRIVLALEKVAVDAVLQTPDRIAQHARIFRYLVQRGMIDQLGNVKVRVADGTDITLGTIRRRSEQGGVKVFFGLAQKLVLNQIMQARGHLVVLLSRDRHRQDAERRYLEKYCAAKTFDGMIDCAERYGESLSRFERVFLGELELTISKSYEVKNFRLTPGKLTEDIPVFVKEHGTGRGIEIFVDVRHQEIAKLEQLGFTQILYSLIASFCREYLGASLKRWSPRFFGDGALNLELLAQRRSELWILLKDDIEVVRKGGQRQVVRRSDVQVVNIGGGGQPPEKSELGKKPRILHIVDKQDSTGLAGFYLRLPDGAFRAYGDLLPECESRGVVWAGNKILYVASDTVSAAFQYEIRLDEVVAAEVNGARRAEGAVELEQPLQQIYDGLYFPIPQMLKAFLVPSGDEEIRVELHCDWIDMRTAKHWEAKAP